MATTAKLSNIQKWALENGFEFATVTMQEWNSFRSEVTGKIVSYTGLVKVTDSGLIYHLRPEANMRSNFKSTILTTSERTISIEKVGA